MTGMTGNEAVKLLQEFMQIEIQTVHAENSARGISQTLAMKERAALRKLFVGLTGRQPNDAELKSLIDF